MLVGWHRRGAVSGSLLGTVFMCALVLEALGLLAHTDCKFKSLRLSRGSSKLRSQFWVP